LPLPPPLTTRQNEPSIARVDELEAVTDALERATPGRGNLVFVAGEPGIGKTHVVAHLAAEAHAQGAAVLYGRTDGDLDIPYEPFTEALGPLVRRASATALQDLLGPLAAALHHVLPATQVPAADPGHTRHDQDPRRPRCYSRRGQVPTHSSCASSFERSAIQRASTTPTRISVFAAFWIQPWYPTAFTMSCSTGSRVSHPVRRPNWPSLQSW